MSNESRSVELTREHRSQHIDKLVQEAPELFKALINSKLLPPDVLTMPIEKIEEMISSRDVNDVESVLFRDPFVCSTCGKHAAPPADGETALLLPPPVNTRVCPVSNQPHRRLLIEIANRLLSLISDARASIVITQDPIPAIPTSGSMSNVSSPITASPLTPSTQSGQQSQQQQQGNFPGDTSSSSSASSRPKIRRPLARKPHLLVLAFHAAATNTANAAASAGQDGGFSKQDDEMRNFAISLVVTLSSIYKTIAEDRANAQNFNRRLQRLLISFDRVWRSYVLRSLENLMAAQHPQQQQQQDTKNETEGSKNPVVVTPPVSPLSIGVSSESPNPPPKKQQQVNDDEHQVSSNNNNANNNNISNSSDHDASLSEPEPAAVMRPVAPPFATRGSSVSTDEESDNEQGSSSSSRQQSSSSRQQQPFGSLVGPNGQPLTAEQQQQFALNILLEQKRRGEEAAAREAYSARVRMRQQNAFAEGNQRVQKVLDAVSEEVESKIFLEELQQRPPKMHRIPVLLRRISESLVGVIPSTRLRQQLERELHDVLDWDVLKHAGPDVVARVMRYVIGKVIELGAPAREETLRQELDTLVNRLQTEEPSAVVVDAIRFLRAAVRTLGDDILKAQLALVRPELAKRALTLQRKYMDDWMSAPPQWIDSTKEWVRKNIIAKIFERTGNDNETHDILQNLNWDQLKNALADGVVDLLRSSGRPANKPRWGEYPTELLYFDKPVLFTSANQVQMLVVRMMIVGTARSILKEYITQNLITHTQVQIFETKLDRKLVEWLTAKEGRMSIAQLKDEVEGEVQFFLNNTAHENAKRNNKNENDNNDDGDNKETNIMLKPAHVTMLRGVMDQMVQVESAVYGTFERKILKVVASLVHKELAKRSNSRGSNISEDLAHRQENADELSSLGSPFIIGDVSNCVLDLCDMIEHHVAVYALRYEFILSQGEKY